MNRLAVSICLAVMAVATIADGITTYIGLQLTGGYEANPVARAVLQATGVTLGLVLICTLRLAFVLGLHVQRPTSRWMWTLPPIAVVWVAVVAQNLEVIHAMGRHQLQ